MNGPIVRRSHRDPEEAADEAWGIVADAAAQAVNVFGLAAEDAEPLKRLMSASRRAARRHPPRPARPPRQLQP